MGWILLILLFILIWPVIRIAWMVYRTRRQFRKAYEQAYQQAYGTPPPGSRGSRRQQQQQPPRRRKIITKDVGEYVDFEEVRTYNADSSASCERTPVTYTAESQIEDAEWEDIKE